MIRIRIVGSPDITDPIGGDANRLLQQPKRFALLAYLAVESRHTPVSRDTLLGIFWPEFETERARHALRQSLHQLRAVLGRDAIRQHGVERISLDPRRISCDAVDILEAIDRAEVSSAVLQLYRGNLLDGFFVSGIPEFEAWVEERRAALRTDLSHAAASAAEQLARAGRWDTATECLQFALRINPSDEARLRQLMKLFEQRGNATAAVAAYEGFARRLALELDMTPSMETEKLATELRLRAPVPKPAVWRWAEQHVGKRNATIAAALVFAIVVVGVGASRLFSARRQPLDARLVAVIPFRVDGAGSGLRYLREGLVDVISAKLGGDFGTRAADARATLATWAQTGGSASDTSATAALATARSLGAGIALVGEVTGEERALTLSAHLLRVSDARELARASVSVSGDSITFGVDRLLATLLSLQAGEEEQRLSTLAQTTPRALQSFLEGERFYRSGQYERAVARYMQALELDSTFALAGLGVANAAAWLGPSTYGNTSTGRALALAWAAREKLSLRDRAVLVGYAGPNYPEVPTSVGVLRAWQHAVELAPDRAEAWYELGDYTLHWGPILDVPHAAEKAEQAFRRAVALQPSFAGPLAHLIELTSNRGAFDDAQLFLRLLQQHQPDSDLGVYLHWRADAAAHNEVGLQQTRALFDSASAASLERIIAVTTLQNFPTADAERAARILETRSQGAYAREQGMVLHDYAAAHGQWQRAHEIAERFSDVDPRARYDLQTRVLDALYDSGDTISAARAAGELAALAREPLPQQPDLRAAQIQNRCILAQWRLLHRDTTAYGATIRMLRTERAQLHYPGFVGADAVCSNILEVLQARITQPDVLPERLERFEWLMLQGPPHTDGTAIASARYGNLLLARMWRETGELQRALKAAQRRPDHWYFGTEFFNGFRAEESRVQALLASAPKQPVQPVLARSR